MSILYYSDNKEVIDKLPKATLQELHTLRKHLEGDINEEVLFAIIDELMHRIVEIGWQDLKKG